MFKKMKIKYFLGIWVFLSAVLNTVSFGCAINYDNCNECIQTSECVWCSSPYFKGNRCFNSSTLHNNKCPLEYILNPVDEIPILENEDIGRDHDESGDFVMPQKMKVKLRLGSSYRIKLKYKLPNQPIDIYYLIDAKSMEINNRNNIIYLSEELTESISNITSNFKIGFGSFVDKVVNAGHEKQCEECSIPYGYLHHTSLTNNYGSFLSQVRQFRRSGNDHRLNGGMDALMQALTCFGPIGWRQNSLKFIIFISDSYTHIAGEGKQYGINQPNDECCHLEASGYYTYSSLRDYPSISQINEKANQNNVKIIFTVTKDELERYSNISRDIQGSTVTELNRNSIAGIQSLIRNSTKLNKVAPEFKYYSDETVAIKLIRTESSEETGWVNYIFELKLVRCPQKGVAAQTIKFYPIGSMQELTVELETICSCRCHALGNDFYQENSTYCSYVGTLSCGVCECSEKRYGKHCQCLERIEGVSCIRENTTEVCSGLGECICGHCECLVREDKSERIYGKYCEFNNFSCNRHEGRICSGHGVCESGVCQCYEGWNGDSCSCSTNTAASCIRENTTEICSGLGQCICGQCQCNAREDRSEKIYGNYCECNNFSCNRHEGRICSGHGICECGSCQCYEGWNGDSCSCSTNTTSCINPNDTNDQICSGYGTCQCGQCYCESTNNVSRGGRYCETTI